MGTMATARVRNRIETREPNFRTYRATLTRNHGAWCPDRHTRGKYTYTSILFQIRTGISSIKYSFRFGIFEL